MELQKLLEKVKAKLIPSEHSRVPDEFVERIRDALPQEVEVIIGGSWAKNTYLPENHDIDVFVRFPQKYDDKKMDEILSLALAPYDAQRVKGSRDYFQLRYEEYEFELVPVLQVHRTQEAKNVTDMSPLHIDYIRAAVKKQPGINNEIRLAKLFAKAQGVYGAESYINGMSGHVIDLLIIYYGTFLNLVQAAQNWPEQLFIDLTGKHADANYLNEAKRMGPLVLIDPVQKDRNAAAALGNEKYILFKKAAQDFLSKPSEKAFLIRIMSIDDIRKKHPQAVIYVLDAVPGSTDVAGTKCYKVHHHVLDVARRLGFKISSEGFSFTQRQALCFVEAENEPLSETFVHQGPPVLAEKDAHKFLEKHPEAKEKNGNLSIELAREHKTLRALLTQLFDKEYFTTRTTRTKLI